MNIMELWSSYRRGADPEEIFSLYQECPLHEKAEGYGDVNLLDEEQSPEAQAKIATGGMTLHQACCQNQSEVVEALLTGGAEG